jgi:hypothetical protein
MGKMIGSSNVALDIVISLSGIVMDKLQHVYLLQEKGLGKGLACMPHDRSGSGIHTQYQRCFPNSKILW